ncbi:MAG: glycosyltransferase family 4 protein [Lachnospiraceae bacterium]|nr:glycosyltransferase family 4 protein [Lachnospiraceae bacterium]
MKILFITNTLSEHRVCFFENLAGKSHIDFMFTHPDMAVKIYGAKGNSDAFRAIDLNGNILKRTKAIKNEIAMGGYDRIILPPADSITQAIEGYTAMKAAQRSGIRYYTWTEKWEAPKETQPFKKKIKNLVQRRIYRTLTRGTQKCIAYGTKSREYLLSVGVPEEKIGISHNTTLPPEPKEQFDIRDKHGLPKDKKLVFCMARLVERKGLDILIDAIALLNRGHSDLILVIGGDGPLKEPLKMQAEKLGLKNVFMPGRINSDVKALYYRQADLSVISSKICGGVIEGWGLVVNEALFNGSPVVATDCVGAAYDMLDGNTGIMVKQGDCRALAEGIEKMLYREDKERITRAIADINEKYSVDVMGDGFLECLQG